MLQDVFIIFGYTKVCTNNNEKANYKKSLNYTMHIYVCMCFTFKNQKVKRCNTEWKKINTDKYINDMFM